MKEQKDNEMSSLDFPDAMFIIDVTFQQSYRPKLSFDEARNWFSGKHKQYGIKTQTIHAMSGAVVHFISGIPGADHDLTCITGSSKYWAVLADKGYQGNR
eukprot:TRINITY_DN7098_c0_g3_i1.p1 TRINITY_DN7098_c0_g3~~TRINITY_DN7098_c0_g3_i1.p1  ORF type:complete len:100 (+),score=21.66 TRINITY_DN7098_c0_g3_i1:321-620(+)